MSPDRTCNSSSWTKEEDKAFETALAIYSGDSNQLMKIAAAVPRKSLTEIIQHYNDLVEDVNDIESGEVPLPRYGRMQSSSSHRSRLSGAEVERQKGIAWTAEEHRLFLQGLEKYGRGDWRSISRNCVLSRTPTQVASHAQKFFSRLNDNNKEKRRKSIHDITSVNAADITESSQGQKSDKLKGSCGVQLQWPITDYTTEASDTGMISLPGPVTNCTTGAVKGPSAVNPEKFPFGVSVGSALNSSCPDADEFLLGVEDIITVQGEGTSGAWRGAETRTSPSVSLQPSVASGTGMYTHPVNNVGYELEEIMTKQLVGATQVGPTVNTAILPLSIADHIGVHGCTASSSGAKNGFANTMGAPKGGSSVYSMQLPSIPGTSGGGTYPCLKSSSKDDNIFDLEDLFPDHILGFGK